MVSALSILGALICAIRAWNTHERRRRIARAELEARRAPWAWREAPRR